jgi:hypothetical protein
VAGVVADGSQSEDVQPAETSATARQVPWLVAITTLSGPPGLLVCVGLGRGSPCSGAASCTCVPPRARSQTMAFYKQIKF